MLSSSTCSFQNFSIWNNSFNDSSCGWKSVKTSSWLGFWEFCHPVLAVSRCSSGPHLPELLELSQREVFTDEIGHPVNHVKFRQDPAARGDRNGQPCARRRPPRPRRRPRHHERRRVPTPLVRTQIIRREVPHLISLECTVLTNWDKVWQNPTRIPIGRDFKLANSATSCDKIESASLYPSEIWQPWCPNFGNPENQIAYLQVFEHA